MTKPGLFLVVLSILCYTIFVFVMHAYLCSASLDLVYIFVIISPGF